MKKVEIYFVIYLSALISILAIEGELKRYKDNQKNILDKIAEEKAYSIVHIKSTDNSDGSNVRLLLDISGDFKFNDTKKFAYFINDENDTTETILKTDKNEGQFVINVQKKKFRQNDIPYDVVLNFDIIPSISEVTRKKWGNDYGDPEIAEKLIDLINEQGIITIKKRIALSITPKIGERSEFTLNGTNILSTIKGVPWNHYIYPGGINSAEGYIINVITGPENIILKKDGIRTLKVSGISYEDTDISIRGVRIADGATDRFNFEVNVIEPRWDSNPPGPDEVCINEPFELNCNIQKIESGRISIVLSGSLYPEKKKVLSPVLKFEGFPLPGKLIADVFIDDFNRKVKSFAVNVIQPSSPTAHIISSDCNEIVVALTAYCTGNEIMGFWGRRGIKNPVELEHKKEILPSKTISYWKFTIRKPENRISQRKIQFIFEDKNGTKVDTSMTTMYDYDCD